MTKKRYITWNEIFDRLVEIDRPGTLIYGVPKGGMIATGFLKRATSMYYPDSADIILDDLIDSGKTRNIYREKYPDKEFVAMFNKSNGSIPPDEWLVFPWEADHPAGEDTIQQNIVRQLQYIGEDPEREGLKETPDRVVRSWDELFAGYNEEPEDVFKIFDDEKVGGMVYLKDIEFYSMCEHHLLSFSGVAHIAYIPNGPVIGTSKMARLLDIFARRLQLQERIGEQVTDALMKYLKPIGAACIIEAKHLCMACRGVKKQHSVMGYSSMKGAFLDDARARAEFIALIK